jgi:hypothetical protein
MKGVALGIFVTCCCFWVFWLAVYPRGVWELLTWRDFRDWNREQAAASAMLWLYAVITVATGGMLL